MCKWCVQRFLECVTAAHQLTLNMHFVFSWRSIQNVHCYEPTPGTLHIQCKLPFKCIPLKTATIHLQIHLGRQSRRHPSLPGSGNAKHLGKSASTVRRVINYLSGKEVIVTQHGFQYRHKRATATKYSWQDEHGRIWREWTCLTKRERESERDSVYSLHSNSGWMQSQKSPRECFESISCSTLPLVTDLFLITWHT